MASSPDLGSALQFLSGLKKNNNKPWFEQNRGRYEQAMEQFESLVGTLIMDLGRIEDLQGLTPRDCIMRIYRDVRFSKDKRPYKSGSRFRDAVAGDSSKLRKILGGVEFKKHFRELAGETLKTAPKGFPTDHRDIELLRHKQVCVMERFDDKAVASPRFPALAAASMKVMKPFIDYLNAVVSG